MQSAVASPTPRLTFHLATLCPKYNWYAPQGKCFLKRRGDALLISYPWNAVLSGFDYVFGKEGSNIFWHWGICTVRCVEESKLVSFGFNTQALSLKSSQLLFVRLYGLKRGYNRMVIVTQKRESMVISSIHSLKWFFEGSLPCVWL